MCYAIRLCIYTAIIIINRWNTEIVLPLKTESSVSRNMVNKFQDIQPSLLLFLNRLRCIIIHDTVSD